MAYTVSKLTDYSAAALEKAAARMCSRVRSEAAAVRSDAELKAFRDRWMARKNGILTQINDLWLKGAPKDAKREAGIRVNELKARIQELVEGAQVGRSDGASREPQSASTSLFPASAARSAPSIPSSRRRTRWFASFRSSATPWPTGLWSRPTTTTLRL